MWIPRGVERGVPRIHVRIRVQYRNKEKKKFHGVVNSRTGVSEWKSWSFLWTHVVVAFIWGMFRHRAQRVRKVCFQLDIPTMSTPAFSKVLSLGVMCGVEKVSQLFNHPVMSLLTPE
jgi:hypothetical protein